ncbi:MAG: 30S ribosomal protein S12 methylthiotransferase RimO [Lachnospiraceae bacterium]|nr:30S ribosomal protein S12 methylthiotransferase RimO [Lachnospiraceae bacterium]
MKVLFVSLGCDKNLTDSEKMLGLLADKGYSFTDDESEAEIAIINTCSFISDAKEESINEIIRIAEYKKSGKLQALIICGCLAERYKDQISTELPEVDGVVGIAGWDEIVRVVEETLKNKKARFFRPQSDNIVPTLNCSAKRHITGGGHYAYLKIAEGCNKRCTYCSIPFIRGGYNSVPMESLIEETEYLAGQGVKELILVAQETTCYGIDIYGKKSLHILLEKLSKTEGIEMIRLFYCYPEEITDELIEEMKSNPKVCHYLDMPLQHSENDILKRMGRRTTREEIIGRIEKLRKEIPDISLRTTIISGFPGESEEDHNNLLEFIDEMEFDHLGAFAYSPEEGTKAEKMPGQIDEDTKKRRVDSIMSLQHEICADINERQVGRTLKVIVDGFLPEDLVYAGRSYMDAPDVDGLVFFKSSASYMTGDIVNVKITGASEYDLIGEVSNESSK